MKRLAFGVLLCGLSPAMAQGPRLKADLKEWDLRDAVVSNFEKMAPRKTDQSATPPSIWFELAKDRSVAVSLCGTDISVEVGAPDSPASIGQLMVQQMVRLKWYKSVFKVVSGKVVLKVSTDDEKQDFEKELKKFKTAHPCDNP